MFSLTLSLSLSLSDGWIHADSGPKLLTNFNFPPPSTARANFQHLLIDNFLPSIDFSCWFIFSNQEVHKNLVNFHCVESIRQNSIMKEVVGVFQPMMRMHSCIPSLVRMVKKHETLPLSSSGYSTAREDWAAQRINAKNHSCEGQTVSMMFQPQWWLGNLVTIRRSSMKEVEKCRSLQNWEDPNIGASLSHSQTQTHKYIHCARRHQIHNKEHNQTQSVQKIHTIACYSYITNNVVLFSRIQTVSKRVGDDEYTMYITHYYQFNWYGSVTGHFFLWVSKMHLICGYFSSLNIDWIDQIARNLVKFLSTFGHVQSSSWKSYLLFF